MDIQGFGTPLTAPSRMLVDLGLCGFPEPVEWGGRDTRRVKTIRETAAFGVAVGATPVAMYGPVELW